MAELLVHRREPPHRSYNADVAWSSVAAATKIRREKPALFAPSFYHAAYRLTLHDGRNLELPANTVLTRAQDEIDRRLEALGIPVEVTTIPMPD